MGFDYFLAFDIFNEVVGWLLMASLATTLDLRTFQQHLKTPHGILIGMVSQFCFMPFFAFAVSTALRVPLHLAVGLQIVCCCPGGVNSNAMCFCFGADVALSVACTSASSLLSLGFMPLSLYLYIKALKSLAPHDTTGVPQNVDIDFAALALSCCILLSGLMVGLYVNYIKHVYISRVLGTMATAGMIALLVLTPWINSKSAQPMWMYPPVVWVSSALPSMLGYLIGIVLSRKVAKLPKPSCIAVAVETAFQNILLAMVIISTSFPKHASGEVLGVPVLYGMFCMLVTISLSLIMHNRGWTHIEGEEKNFSICMLVQRYRKGRAAEKLEELEEAEKKQHGEEMEVVSVDKDGQNDKNEENEEASSVRKEVDVSSLNMQPASSVSAISQLASSVSAISSAVSAISSASAMPTARTMATSASEQSTDPTCTTVDTEPDPEDPAELDPDCPAELDVEDPTERDSEVSKVGADLDQSVKSSPATSTNATSTNATSTNATSTNATTQFLSRDNNLKTSSENFSTLSLQGKENEPPMGVMEVSPRGA